jgi:epoxyqueuosine reductase
LSDSPAERAERERLTQSVRAEARRLRFDVVGVAGADRPLTADYARYEAFLAAGYHGSMDYLAADAEVRERLDRPSVLEGARSVICLARSYKRNDDHDDGPMAQRVARYARGHDYHNGLRKRLRRLAAFVRGLAPGVSARPLVDDAPILERAWAAQAGLGFVGKNGLLIAPGVGSYVLLGEVVTTLALAPDDPLPGRCGACTRCLDACPTQALVRPFVLDARRCVAYLTIEHEGPLDPALREGVGERVFGCDVCQEVGPFNAGRAEAADAQPFRPHARLEEASLEGWLGLDAASFEALLSGSPLGRPGLEGLQRNAAIALGNRGDPAARPALAARAADPRTAPSVREAAAWALDRLGDG